jgi:protein gp37
MSTKIPWVKNPDGSQGEAWNPITGCSHAGSLGCDNCYAEAMSKRFGWHWGSPVFHPERLEIPLRWRKPRTIFVCSMSDLFHEQVEFTSILHVLRVMYECPQHTFLVLTKRPERLIQLEWDSMLKLASPNTEDGVELPNLWLGVTVCNQQEADEKIPLLLQIPAAKRFVSIEPMLGAIDLLRIGKTDVGSIPWNVLKGEYKRLSLFDGSCELIHTEKLDWVICGGESGSKARPVHPDWVRSLRDQCVAADVPFFFKQWGEWITVEDWWEKPLSGHSECWLTTKGKMTTDGITATDEDFLGCENMLRVGKKLAGNLLDGKVWEQMPEVSR